VIIKSDPMVSNLIARFVVGIRIDAITIPPNGKKPLSDPTA